MEKKVPSEDPAVDSGDEEKALDNIDPADDDPELAKLREEIKEQKARAAAHKRERTSEIKARLEKQIDLLATEKVNEVIGEAKTEAAAATVVAPVATAPIVPVPAAKEEDRKLGSMEEDPDIMNLYKDIDAKYRAEMDDMWSKYVEDAKAPEVSKEAKPETDFGLIHEAIMTNPFLRKMIKPSEQTDKDTVIGKLNIKEDYKMPNYLLYDLLTERFNTHASVVPDYSLHRILIDNERSLKSKYLSANCCVGIQRRRWRAGWL